MAAGAGAGWGVVGAASGAVVGVEAVVTSGTGSARRDESPEQPALMTTVPMTMQQRAATKILRTAARVGATAYHRWAVGLVATTVWRIRPEVVLALNDRLGPPVDSYLNGSQTWFTEAPGRADLEWRLHPVAGYRLPGGLSHYDLWDAVVDGLLLGADPAALTLGREVRPLHSLWDGLECFAAHGEDLEPPALSAAAFAGLGLAPDAAGLVDHDRIGDEWERNRGAVSIVALLLEQLRS